MMKIKIKSGLALAILLSIGASVGIGGEKNGAEKNKDAGPAGLEGAAESPAGEKPEGYNVYLDWLESNHESGMADSECVMCAGFGGGFKCGLSCDATGLSIVKPDGSRHHICGVCDKGTWTRQ